MAPTDAVQNDIIVVGINFDLKNDKNRDVMLSGIVNQFKNSHFRAFAMNH